MSIPPPRLVTALADRYEIERELGEGGMATVYLATDVKHRRRVALKVLKPELAAVVGAERFLAEIETTANLTHPHILPLHDSGEADSFLFYVMPYLEGESLRQRLDRGHQLPVEEAVRIATDVAEALDYAHRHDVIHRDIKPANIMMQDGRPLIADFGIALAVGTAGSTRLTETGLSVGTPYYMSPEQATGDSAVGPETDIYALAGVLYETLVGDPPYQGSTAQAVLGKILQGRPVSARESRLSVPVNVDAAIRKALEKLPADRFHAAKEFADALNDPGFRYGESDAVHDGAVSKWRKRAYALGGVAVLMAGVAAWAALSQESSPPEPVTRLSVRMPAGQEAGATARFDLSDDGQLLVYEGPGTSPGSTQLWLRDFSLLDARPLPGSEGAIVPEISPDGREIAFLEGLSVKVLPIDGGVARTVAGSSRGASPVAWDGDGDWIYFAAGVSSGAEGLARVPSEGGDWEQLTELAPTHDGHTGPSPLPGSRWVLFEASTGSEDSVAVLDLETREYRTLFVGESPRWGEPGHIVYRPQASATLMAVPFDPRSGEVTGSAAPLVENLAPALLGWHPYELSASGRIVMRTTVRGGSDAARWTPVWIDRDGQMEVVDSAWQFHPGNNNRGIDISPDGSRVVVNLLAGEEFEDIWLKQLTAGPFSRLTTHPTEDVRPKWTPNGSSIIYVSRRGDNDNPDADADVWVRRADGIGEPELLLDYVTPIWEVEVTPDMEWIVARVGGQIGAAGARDLVIKGPDDEEARLVLQSEFDEYAIRLSPDGRWLAYESDETGDNEVYVRPFPNIDAGKFPVSQQGGVMPMWGNNGNELFYVNRANQFVAATWEIEGDAFRVTDLNPLFDLPEGLLFNRTEFYALYDVSNDDQRFLWMMSTLERDDRELILFDNWPEELRKRVGR